MPRVVVVGAGISGLATAYHLSRLRPDVEITVLESAHRPGGTIHTERSDGFVVEHGPNGFLDGVPSTLELAREVGLGDRLVSASDASRKHRYLFLDERIRELPRGPGSFLTSSLLPMSGKLRMMMEPMIGRGPGGPESVAAFARRRFGRAAADVFIDALVTGIHGGDPELLDVRAAFPRLTRYERESGSVIRGVMAAGREKKRAARARGESLQPQRMWSFRAGLRELIDAVVARLPAAPFCGVDVESVSRSESSWHVHGNSQTWVADALVLACPAPIQARIMSQLDSALSDRLAEIVCNRIAVVALGFRAADVPRPYDGFGFIAPQNTRQDLLGVQWCSAIYPDRAPGGMVLYRALCGGWHRAEVVDWPDDRLIAAVGHALRSAHGIDVPPAFARIVRWSPAIPQYMLGHPERVAEIDRLAAGHPRLFLTGNSFHGVALNDCTANAKSVAGRVAESLAGT
ncbi:MAG: protoporphyrinogen oxidase [Gemmataceae bacterium]|nr:protoporphyrinogen oxidase [Gemmataceae bacterium]